jgi:pyruvate dehydrogenase (quinone)
VLEVKTDPNIPPLPPHITLKQAKAFASTLIKGDPEEASVILKSLRQFAEEWVPQ